MEEKDRRHYETMTEALDAIEAFRNKVGLPFPSIIVGSGGGLHIYWLLAEPIDLRTDLGKTYLNLSGLETLALRPAKAVSLAQQAREHLRVAFRSRSRSRMRASMPSSASSA